MEQDVYNYTPDAGINLKKKLFQCQLREVKSKNLNVHDEISPIVEMTKFETAFYFFTTSFINLRLCTVKSFER